MTKPISKMNKKQLKLINDKICELVGCLDLYDFVPIEIGQLAVLQDLSDIIGDLDYLLNGEK